MRTLTFQVKLPPPGKVSVELYGPKLVSPKASPAAFGELLRGETPQVGHRPLDRRPPQGQQAEDERDRKHGEDPTDPQVRHAAQLGPPPGLARGEIVSLVTAPVESSVVEARARASLEELLPALVRRVAWSGDGRRGTVRLELGSGVLAGAELVVHADEGRVRVQLRGPVGVDLGPLRERIAVRLAARGLALEEVE